MARVAQDPDCLERVVEIFVTSNELHPHIIIIKRLVDTIVSLCSVFQKDVNKLSSYRDAMQLLKEQENAKNVCS